jgi:hypothetical protein
MRPSDRRRRLDRVLEEEVGVVWGSVYSGLIVIGAVALAFVAFAVTLAQHA